MVSFESVESRLFLSATPEFDLTSKGTLIVHGTAGANRIDVDYVHQNAANKLDITVGTKDDLYGVLNPADQFRINPKSVKRLVIDAGAGDDEIIITGAGQMTLPTTILGGAGDDRITPSDIAPTFTSGGDGNDTIGGVVDIHVASKFNHDVIKEAFTNPSMTVETLLGGAGNDTLVGDINDLIDGGAGHDTGRIFTSTTANSSPVSPDRGNALAHDYYQRVGATSLEETESVGNVSTFTTAIGTTGFSLTKIGAGTLPISSILQS
ncbi:MAG TPA: hypothetical protein VHS31_14190 [Tepidisphaeraceae bacterium]|nr:hypothetical protein [Tepidisphaeraceae bacterium]